MRYLRRQTEDKLKKIVCVDNKYAAFVCVGCAKKGGGQIPSSQTILKFK